MKKHQVAVIRSVLCVWSGRSLARLAQKLHLMKYFEVVFAVCSEKCVELRLYTEFVLVDSSR